MILRDVRRNRFDRDLKEDLRFHEEMKARDIAHADGMSVDEARAAARRRIGNPLRLREQWREPWTFPRVETFAQDVRHALRLMRRDPAFGLGGIVIDARVMTFCLGLSLVSTLLIGLVPALRVSGAAFGEGLALHAGESRTTGDSQGEQLRTLLVAGQIAMTLVLLIGAGLLIHSFVRLTSVSPGFALGGRDGVVQTVKVTLPERLYDEPERIQAFTRGVLNRIQYLPGVKSASVINSAPFGIVFIRDEFEIEGQPKPTLDAGRPKIDADYFKPMGIPLLAGREFSAQDTKEAPKVAIISERIVREYFPGGQARRSAGVCA